MFSLAGMPPLAIFTSEFYTVAAGVEKGSYIAIALLILGLTIVFYGLVKNFIKVAFGKEEAEVIHKSEVSFAANFPLIVLGVIICLIGIMPPDGLMSLLNSAVSMVLGNL